MDQVVKKKLRNGTVKVSMDDHSERGGKIRFSLDPYNPVDYLSEGSGSFLFKSLRGDEA